MKDAHTAYRVAAYIVDVIIISIITSILVMGFPRNSKYENADKENQEILNKVFKGEMEEDEALDSFYSNKYTMEKETFPESIISVTVIVGYFVIFAFFNKGQTLGKKLLHIRVVSNSEEDASYIQLFGRALIINDCFLSLFSIAVISFIKPNQYLYTIGMVTFIHAAILICSVMMAFCRKDKRALHDLIFRTRVVEE